MPDTNQPDPTTPSETPVSEETPISTDTPQSIPASTSEPTDMPSVAPEAPADAFTPPLAEDHN